MSTSTGDRTGSRHSTRWVGVMVLAVFVTLGTVSCSWFGEHPRLATRTFNEYYGTEGQELDDCAVSHSSGRSLNEYGKAVRAAIPDGDGGTDDDVAQLLRAFAAVEGLDSDGDGFTNGVEIHAGAFPGDGGDRPSP